MTDNAQSATYVEQLSQNLLQNTYTYDDQGMLNGQARLYDGNQLIQVMHYKNNVLHGPFHKYQNNSLILLTSYIDGQLDGMYYIFDQTNRLALSATYKQGLKQGVELVWQNGIPIVQNEYSENVLIATQQLK